MQETYLKKFLKRFPICHSVVRARECELLQGVKFSTPLLDAGCQDGVFVSLLGSLTPDLGVDRDEAALRKAGTQNVYRALLKADLGRLPIRTGTYASILSNSTLEHVEDLDAALKEFHRVLKPGGCLVATVPNSRFEDELLLRKLFAFVGAGRLARRYVRLIHRYYRHEHIWVPDKWEAALKTAGFPDVSVTPFLSPGLFHLHESTQLLGLPVVATKKILGRWILFPSLRRKVGVVIYWLIGWLYRNLRDRGEENGVLLMIRAMK